jgi:hypothetical protein
MDDQPKVYEWDAVLVKSDGVGSGAFVGFPWNPKECFGKANLVPVWAEFDGVRYRGSIANMGTGPCLIVLKQIRDKIGKQAGDAVHVKVWHDTEPRVVEAPADLAAVLTGRALEAWKELSNSHRREYVQWIEGAKKAETRALRVAKAVLRLAEGRPLQ